MTFPSFSVGEDLTAADMNAVGLWRVTPTSVSGTGTSIASNGDVIITNGGSNFTVNGAFSSSYSNYKLLFRDFRSSGNTGLFFALGTSNTGTDHRSAGVFVSTGGAVSGEGISNGSRWGLGIVMRGNAISTGGEMTLIGPQKTEETTFTLSGVDSDTGSVGRFYSGINLANTAFTAFYCSTATTETFVAGRISIYGFNG